jgi:V/A-type H+-transporting ATPase subunit A
LLNTIVQDFQSFIQKDEPSDRWKNAIVEFPRYIFETLSLLSAAAEIESIARVIGESALPDEQRLILLTAEILKEGFLRQSAFNEVDAYCDIQKQFLLLKMIIDFHEKAMKLIKDRVPINVIREIPQISIMMRVKEDPGGTESIFKVIKDTEKTLETVAIDHGSAIMETV